MEVDNWNKAELREGRTGCERQTVHKQVMAGSKEGDAEGRFVR